VRRTAVDIRRTVARLLTLFCTLCVLAVLPASASAAPKKVMFKFSATGYSVAAEAGAASASIVMNTAASARPRVNMRRFFPGTVAG
jgi:hypothetical protein